MELDTFAGWYSVARMVIGVALVYALAGPFLAWFLGGLNVYTCLCAVCDTFFTVAFVTIAVLMRLHFPCAREEYAQCMRRIPTLLAPSFAA